MIQALSIQPNKLPGRASVPEITSSSFAEIVRKAKERKAAQELLGRQALNIINVPALGNITGAGNMDDLRKSEITLAVSTDKYGNTISYNSAQAQFINLAISGQSCILIGAAGTGKTTCMKGTVQGLSQASRTAILQNHDHKHLPNGVPGIIVCAYTRRATNNIRRNMDEHMKGNCVTIHKLLEYAPVYYSVIGDDGKEKNTMSFEPTRNQLNPLPAEITTIIFEESSMIGTDLYNQVLVALPNPQNTQIIFLGDIQQLPPVFGSAILGFKLLELPTVELTEVYRQALESPIIKLAHRILSGKPIPPSELESWNTPDQMKITPWKKKVEAESALAVSEKLFSKLYNEGQYNPEEDIILIPFNKGYGTIELNRSIANHIARKKELVTYEVIAGFLKHYFSVGDKVLYDREDAIILEITPNMSYGGAPAQDPSLYLDYWGHDNTPANKRTYNESSSGEDIDFLLAQVSMDDGDRVTQSSHTIKLLMQDTDTERTISKASEVNSLILGYALTVHKSQGSEWEKVFLLLHNSHATMLQRELLYTAVTRAKKELFIICEGDTFTKGVISQRIKGNTLAEKAIHFQGKIDAKTEQS